MFSTKEFGGCEAQLKLAELKGKYTLEEGLTCEQVKEQIDKVMFATKIYTGAPAYVMSKALYSEEDDVFTSARFIIRPSSKAELTVDDVKKTFVINAEEDFFDKLITKVAEWFDEYNEYAKFEANLTALNNEVIEICTEKEITPVNKVTFTLGEGIVDIGLDHVVVGLSADVVKAIGDLPLFNALIESKRENYREAIADAIVQCTNAYEFVKVKNVVTRDLGTYARRSIHKLIREIVNRNIDFVRVGVGYYETDDVFAVVEKVAITEATEVEEGTLVVDNDKVSTAEAKKGLTKIAVTYKVAPFDKNTGEVVDLDLATIVGK